MRAFSVSLFLIEAVFEDVAKYGRANLGPIFAASAFQPMELLPAEEHRMNFLEDSAIKVIDLTETARAAGVFGIIHHGKEQCHEVM